MPLNPGTHLGPYEILGQLGAGGMGEVYKARDTRLNRTVAIKILPTDLGADAERRRRFEREAQIIARLNHPHICVLHDVGHQDDLNYLVMEYLEGETLAQRLGRGALAIEQALQYSVQIADALDKAHRQGVVHRDLKPGNIMLTKTGAKLLDFGLAKLKGPRDSMPPSALPTQSRTLTAEGTILGTLQYMAPEQVEGKDTDARTDIFAFGAVLYEMVTGKQAFEGSSQAGLMAAILERHSQPVSRLQPMTPPALDQLISRCLAKDPDNRWQTSRDLLLQLAWITQSVASDAGTALGVRVPAHPDKRRWLSFAAVWLFLSTVALALIVVYLLKAREPAGVMQFAISPPENATFTNTFAVSPDGRHVAFVANQGGKNLLWIRSLDSLHARPLSGTEGASWPFWSPHGQFVAYFAAGRLKKVNVGGGLSQELCEARTTFGGTWSPQGVILFAETGGGLRRVGETGGEPTSLKQPYPTEVLHHWPHFLPDGRQFLYMSVSGISVGSLDSKPGKRLLPDLSPALYDPSGYLLFVRSGTLMAQSFDANKLELKGEAFPLAENVMGYPYLYGGAHFSVSRNGTLVYRSSQGFHTRLAWLDRSGNPLAVVGKAGIYDQVQLSPDGEIAAISGTEAAQRSRDLWLVDLGRDITSRFTFQPSDDDLPVWSPDGKMIVFTSEREGVDHLYRKAADGTTQEEVVLKGDGVHVHSFDWSRDGRFIAYTRIDPKTRADLWILPTGGDRKPFLFLGTEFNEGQPQFSPDGKWIAYFSEESGQLEVYVQSFPHAGGKWQISTSGGRKPRWRKDGNELFYIASDWKLMAVTVKTSPTFEAGTPQALFETPVRRVLSLGSPYDVAPDGRFLFLLAQELSSSPIIGVLNWRESAKK